MMRKMFCFLFKKPSESLSLFKSPPTAGRLQDNLKTKERGMEGGLGSPPWQDMGGRQAEWCEGGNIWSCLWRFCLMIDAQDQSLNATVLRQKHHHHHPVSQEEQLQLALRCPAGNRAGDSATAFSWGGTGNKRKGAPWAPATCGSQARCYVLPGCRDQGTHWLFTVIQTQVQCW